MSAALLDVNVLIALLDRRHVHHEPAHRWFAGSSGPWASPVTPTAPVLQPLWPLWWLP